MRLLEMTTAHVASCLRRLGMSRHVDAFQRHGIDGRACDYLDGDVLRLQLNVASRDERRRFLEWVERMQPFSDPYKRAAHAAGVAWLHVLRDSDIEAVL